MQRFDKIDYTFIGVALVAILALIWALPMSERTLVNSVSIIGSVASLFGVAIAIKQLVSLRQIAEETRAKLIGSINKADSAKAIEQISQVIFFLRENRLESAWIRLRDLKALAVQIQETVDLSKLEMKAFKQTVADIESDIVTLDARLRDSSQNTDLQIVKHLEVLSTILLRIDAKLKFNRSQS
jgi:hypothetical protein